MAISDMSKSTFWLHLSEPEHNPFAFQTRAATSVYEKSAPLPWDSWLSWTSYLNNLVLNSLLAEWVGMWAVPAIPAALPGLPASRIPRDSVRDARTAFATRCPPGRAEAGVRKCGRGADGRHLSSCKPQAVTHGRSGGRASAARALLHLGVIRAKPTGMHLTHYTKPGIFLEV